MVVLILAFSLTSFGYAESTDSKIEKEIVASFQSLANAAKKLDTGLYFKHFDLEKFVGLNSDGTNWNSIDDFIPLINAGFDSIEEVISLDFTNVNVLVIDDYTAILVNEYSQSMRLQNQDVLTISGGGSQVWSKRSGNWKIVSVSASNKPYIGTP